MMSSEYPQYQQPPTGDNFALGLIVATGVAILGVAAWAALAESLQLRSAFVAFGVAFGTVAVFRRYAPRNPMAPVAVVVLTVASSVVGLLASQYGLAAHAAHLSYFTVVKDVPLSKIPHFMTLDTGVLTWVIVALSGYSGYRGAQQLRAHQRVTQPPVYAAPPPVPPAADSTPPQV